jgi:Sporulation related domain.
MASKFKTDGLNPVITRFRNGFYVVLAEGFDSREAGEAALKRVPYSGYGPGVVVLYRRTQDLVVESTE